MFRRSAVPPPADDRDTTADDAPDHAPDDVAPSIAPPDLAALPIAGITRRRMAGAVAGILAAWIVIVFTRQVTAAADASTRATDIAADNAGLQHQVAALDRELDLIARPRYVAQQARGYRLGGAHEIAFTLAPDAPALPADAPGSAGVRVGAQHHDASPLDRWLTVLFGPTD